MWGEQPVPEAMARSPSRESFGTDLSLLSLSSLGSERARARRCLLQVPGELRRRRPLSGEVLLEEEAAAPLVKSFSTADIVQAAAAEQPLRASVSELALAELPARLESRSCSTWVAVGDVASSQLPSPQASEAALAPADLVRSVSTRVRQMYIRRRLLSTHRALERLTKSELDVSGSTLPRVHVTADAKLTVRDVQRDRGKPLTKYERNMMIFDWLQNLDQS
ncbi:uncharacterized protein LOC119449427 [Dermacentor silvarum]|uniref:uncharacterized protein LOC119449427 n=1 Tax=Dermacentor silvarum TaxID=543639 RepID=UPI00189B468A|nr:uncharacterized protein LOC119449427 [Dermacentor silvarum]